jgi:hypothetical protein
MGKILGRWALFVVMSALASSLHPTVGAQTKQQPVLSEDEKREAEQLSQAFTRRLGQTLDMAVVMKEFFLADSVERYLATEKQKASTDRLSSVFFSPGIVVDISLFERPELEDWQRFYIAENNFMLLGFIRATRRNVDFENLKATDLYPREVIELLDRNPLLSNLILKKSSSRNFKSFEEMRSATATLEQAVAIMHKGLPETIDLEKEVVQQALHKSSVKRPPDEKELERARAELMSPQLEIADSEYFGFPKGTRVISVATFSFHQLLLVKVNGLLKVVWAYPFVGD